MGEVHPLSENRRQFIADGDHSDLRATWHRESGFVVLSLWRGDTCVGTSHMTPREAGRLATFITEGLADLASQRRKERSGSGTPRTNLRSVPDQLAILIRKWRISAARSFESIARALRK